MITEKASEHQNLQELSTIKDRKSFNLSEVLPTPPKYEVVSNESQMTDLASLDNKNIVEANNEEVVDLLKIEENNKKVKFTDVNEIFYLKRNNKNRPLNDKSTIKTEKVAKNSDYEVQGKTLTLRGNLIFRYKRAKKYIKSLLNKVEGIKLFYKSIEDLKEDIVIMALEEQKVYCKNRFKISGLKYNDTKPKLINYFENFGDIEKIDLVVTNKGFCRGSGIIHFNSVKKSFLTQKHLIEGREVFISKILDNNRSNDKQQEIFTKSENVKTTNSVVIKNVETKVSKLSIQKFLKQQHKLKIKNISIVCQKIFGPTVIVDFFNSKQASWFIKKFNIYKKIFGFGSAAQFNK